MTVLNKMKLVETTFDKIDIDKITFWYNFFKEPVKTLEKLSLKNYKTALKYIISKYPNRLKIFSAINYGYQQYRGICDSYNTISYNSKPYFISGVGRVLDKMSLSEFVDLKFSGSTINTLYLSRRESYDMKDYDEAVKLVTEGKVQFINLFGKDRYSIKSADDLLAMMKSTEFFSTKVQPMCGRSYGEANIAAVFNYHCHLFNKDIFDFLTSFIDSEENKSEYQIIKRVKDKLKKAKIEKEKVPDEFLLFLEIAN